jgi:hypothetical protein
VSRQRPFHGVSTIARVLGRPKTTRVILSVESSSLGIHDTANGSFAILELGVSTDRRVVTELSFSTLLRRHARSMPEIRDALTSLFTHTTGVRGHVHVSSDWTYVSSETDRHVAYPMDPLWPEEATYTRIRQVAPYREQRDLRVLGAYWGTLLGAAHVETLGGVRRVQAEAPVAVVEVLDGGAMYLQATPDPEPLTTAAMQHVLPKLEAYLAPVRVPVTYFGLPPGQREVKQPWER